MLFHLNLKGMAQELFYLPCALHIAAEHRMFLLLLLLFIFLTNCWLLDLEDIVEIMIIINYMI